MKYAGFAICLDNTDYTVSLELRKIYPILEPYSNDPTGYLRIVDESGEDYLYPDEWFETVSFGKKLESRLLETLAA